MKVKPYSLVYLFSLNSRSLQLFVFDLLRWCMCVPVCARTGIQPASLFSHGNQPIFSLFLAPQQSRFLQRRDAVDAPSTTQRARLAPTWGPRVYPPRLGIHEDRPELITSARRLSEPSIPPGHYSGKAGPDCCQRVIVPALLLLERPMALPFISDVCMAQNDSARMRRQGLTTICRFIWARPRGCRG